MKKVTILDIANELNITFSTVARALNDHPAISIATKKAVKEVAERLNYQQNKIASSLRSGKSNVIGVLVPSLEVSFFSSVINGIEKVMNENGYYILLYQSNESSVKEQHGINTFLQARVGGILASVSKETVSADAYWDIVNQAIPLLFFDRSLEDIDVPTVTVDDYKGGFIATEHLINEGYRKIVHINSNSKIGIFKERLRGYKDALKAYDIALDEQLIFKGNFSIRLGKSIIESLINKGIEFDAVFAAEDYTAMGVLEALQNAGIKVPDEVGVIGFANESFTSLVNPSLSTIDQQNAKMGEEIAKLFLSKTKSKSFYKSKPEKIILEPLLIARKSSLRGS